jgi:hypothetical protein
MYGLPVEKLLKKLRYELVARGFFSRRGYWINPTGRTGFDSTSNRNEYQEYLLESKGGRCEGLKTFHFQVPII